MTHNPTQGEWKQSDHNALIITNSDGVWIAEAYSSKLTHEENEANARLIAAAPETKRQRDMLLEALETLTKEFLYFIPGAEENNLVLREAKAAARETKQQGKLSSKGN